MNNAEITITNGVRAELTSPKNVEFVTNVAHKLDGRFYNDSWKFAGIDTDALIEGAKKYFDSVIVYRVSKSVESRKLSTRRKIILGAALEKAVVRIADCDDIESQIIKDLYAAIIDDVRDRDRILFTGVDIDATTVERWSKKQ